MLVLTRKPGQSIKILPDANLDPKTPVGELLAEGPIEIVVCGVSGGQVKLGVRAHPDLVILRGELCGSTE